MKYKVGDKVKVRQDLVDGEEYGDYPWGSNMNRKHVTINGVCDTFYTTEDSCIVYTDEMLDGLVEESEEPTDAELIQAAEMLFEHCNKRAVNDDCTGCPFDNVSSDGYCGLGTPCDDWCLLHVKTRKELLLEKFPKTDIKSLTESTCPSVFGICGGLTHEGCSCDGDCEDCWNAPAESEEE